MRHLFWTIPAEADLAGIDDYWWPIDPEMAETLIGRIEDAAARLLSLPEGGALIDREATRKWRAPRTPYVLLYRVRADRIEILRVHHDRQDWRP